MKFALMPNRIPYLRHFPRSERGFTLIELVVVITMAGMALLVAVRLVNVLVSSTADKDNVGLQAAYAALVGYAKANATLPSSDNTWLPSSLVGNVRGNRLKYHVASPLTKAPPVIFTPSANFPINSPGLNFCLYLTRLRSDEQIFAGVGGQNLPLIALLEYSSSGATASAPSDVALPGSDQAVLRAVQGRQVRAISASELFSALSCSERLSRVAAAARNVDVATDLLELAKLNTQHWRNAIVLGQAQNSNTRAAMDRLNSWWQLLIADSLDLSLNYFATMPYSAVETPTFLIMQGIYASTIAQVIVQRDMAISADVKWTGTTLPDAQKKVDEALVDEAAFAAALEDAKSELMRLASLGLTQ